MNTAVHCGKSFWGHNGKRDYMNVMKKLVKKESKEYKCDFCDVKFLNKSKTQKSELFGRERCHKNNRLK